MRYALSIETDSFVTPRHYKNQFQYIRFSNCEPAQIYHGSFLPSF
jgi:hypothetical protein